MRGSCSGRWSRSAYGEQDGFRDELSEAGLPFVMALKPRRGSGLGPRTRTPRWTQPVRWPGTGPDEPGYWHAVTRTFRDGHAETWWAADATVGWGARTAPGAWRWPPLTRPRCRTRPPGTWSIACSASAGTPGYMTTGTASSCGTAARIQPRRERGSHPAVQCQRRRSRERCARYAPGFPLGRAATLVADRVRSAPATAAGPDQRPRSLKTLPAALLLSHVRRSVPGRIVSGRWLLIELAVGAEKPPDPERITKAGDCTEEAAIHGGVKVDR